MTERIEGSGASQLVQLIKHFGYNKEINIELATVTAPPPNLSIKVDNMSEELTTEDLIVSQHLTKYSRTVTLTSTTVTDILTDYSHTHTDSSGGTTSKDTHNHDITDLTIDGTLDFKDELKKNDRVIVAETDGGQTYVILDKAVKY